MDLLQWLKHQWDRTAAVVVTVIGLGALLLGWLGVSRSSLPAEQIPYLASGAVGGLLALGIAATLWLSADLRDLWRKFDEIDEHRHCSDHGEQQQEATVWPPAGAMPAASADAGLRSEGASSAGIAGRSR